MAGRKEVLDDRLGRRREGEKRKRKGKEAGVLRDEGVPTLRDARIKPPKTTKPSINAAMQQKESQQAPVVMIACVGYTK